MLLYTRFLPLRKVTYKNLERWYEELQSYCRGIPTIVVANKIDVDYQVRCQPVAAVAAAYVTLYTSA